MRDPLFKVNLFRLVDVLPALRSDREVSEHVSEYLYQPLSRMHPFLGWWVQNGAPGIRSTIVRWATLASVKFLARRFIAGSNPKQALTTLQRLRRSRLAFTLDLLGEFSVSEEEAFVYLTRYLEALSELSKELPRWDESEPLVRGHPGEHSGLCLSVKLTALYSQCGPLNFARSVAILSSRLGQIVKAADRVGAQVYIDAEDSANNPIIYETFKQVFLDHRESYYPGIVVQAYARNAEAVLLDLLRFARTRGRPIAIRLVKGAYWDYELVTSTQAGLQTPLFTHKRESDANFERLTRILIDNANDCLPAIASHNIRSLAHACCYAEARGVSKRQIEVQMLYGMAEELAQVFSSYGYLARLYVPLGDMFVGMGYLVRRLLENTSNESFLRQSNFEEVSIERLLASPASTYGTFESA